MDTVLSIRINEKMLRQLDDEAARGKVSRSEVIRRKLRGGSQTKRASAYDALARFAGIMDGPSDLSTNKKRLAGMGKSKRQ